MGVGNSWRNLFFRLQGLLGMTPREARMFVTVSSLLLVGSVVRYLDFYSETAGNPEFVEFDREFRRLTARADSLARADSVAAARALDDLPEFQPAPTVGLDLNRATLAQLVTLPRIGPSIGSAILETRERLGGFRGVDDLLLVSGIGKKTLDRLRPLVRVAADTSTLSVTPQ